MSKFIELLERLVVAQETIAANLQLQTEFAAMRNKEAMKKHLQSLKRKGNFPSQVVTEKKEESEREELPPKPPIGEKEKEESKEQKNIIMRARSKYRAKF